MVQVEGIDSCNSLFALAILANSTGVYTAVLSTFATHVLLATHTQNSEMGKLRWP